MRLEDAARRVLEPLCDELYEGFGIVVTDSEILRRRLPKRRAVTREKAQRRLAAVVADVAAHLRAGGTPAGAREIAQRAGFAESIRVTQGHGALHRAIAERLRSGDNAWADVSDGARAVIVLTFWHDPTHRRVF